MTANVMRTAVAGTRMRVVPATGGGRHPHAAHPVTSIFPDRGRMHETETRHPYLLTGSVQESDGGSLNQATAAAICLRICSSAAAFFSPSCSL